MMGEELDAAAARSAEAGFPLLLNGVPERLGVAAREGVLDRVAVGTAATDGGTSGMAATPGGASMEPTEGGIAPEAGGTSPTTGGTAATTSGTAATTGGRLETGSIEGGRSAAATAGGRSSWMDTRVEEGLTGAASSPPVIIGSFAGGSGWAGRCCVCDACEDAGVAP